MFYGDETLLTSHETPAFSLLVMSTKFMIFNTMDFLMKFLLRLALYIQTTKRASSPLRS